jgi:multiple sugar transport system substrate-binding protein
MERRVVGALLLTVGTIGATGGVALAQESSLPGTGATGDISFVVAQYSTKTGPFWEKVVSECEAANPGLNINLEVLGWEQAHDSTAQRIAAGTFPDLLNTATIWVPEWADAGAIQPVSDALVPADIAADFVPALYEKSALYNGQSWGLPIAAASRGLFYNTDLFTAAGLDPAAPPVTWQEFKDAAVAIHDATGEYGYAFDAKGVTAFRSFGFFLWNNGGDFFTEDGKAAFNSEEGVEALQFLVDLAATGATPDPSGILAEEVGNLFHAGKLGMFIDGNYQIAVTAGKNPDLQYAVTDAPIAAADTAPVTWGVTDTLVIGQNADPARVQAVITCIYQPSVRTEFDVAEGLLPVLQSQAGDPAFADPKVQAFASGLEAARFDPLNPKYSQMQELVKTAMQEAFTGVATPKEALDKAAAAFDALP